MVGYRVSALVMGLMIVLALLMPGTHAVHAAEPPPSNLRQVQVITPYTSYNWWVLRWSNNSLLCTLQVDHEGLPTGNEVFDSCGKAVWEEWSTTPICNPQNGDVTTCTGVYLYLVNNAPAEKMTLVDYPPPVVWLSISNCPEAGGNILCRDLPILLFTGEEPLPGEQIIAIHGLYDGEPFSCAGNSCLLPVKPSPMRGVKVEFWAQSSFGDLSPHYHAVVRVLDSGLTNTGAGGWFIDILSTQWQGQAQPICAQIWDTFPPIGNGPAWLTTPPLVELMASEAPYQYLAGRLIAQGVIEAGDCPTGGLLPNGYADACGLDAALDLVHEWQNQYDPQIFLVANEMNLPGQLMKNLFAQESQFWPGVFKDPKEFGLGQLTDLGAETLLIWNTAYYNQFCPTVLDEKTCRRGYVFQTAEIQALLRGALAQQARVDCPDCEFGIDAGQVGQTIQLFGSTLIANCAQVSRIIYNQTGKSPGVVSDYTNLWKLTAANYHVGPGCTSYAVYQAWRRNRPMTWENIAEYLTPPCQSAIQYVEQVTGTP
jgi:hypothetical protein